MKASVVVKVWTKAGDNEIILNEDLFFELRDLRNDYEAELSEIEEASPQLKRLFTFIKNIHTIVDELWVSQYMIPMFV